MIRDSPSARAASTYARFVIDLLPGGVIVTSNGFSSGSIGSGSGNASSGIV
jgi:hypothetical protein